MQRISKNPAVRSRRFCSVPQCCSYCTKDISLHSFPIANPKLCKQWKLVLKIDKPITKYMLVCSLHFVASDFTLTCTSSKLRRLKKNSVPSQKIPVLSCVRPKIKIDRDRPWLKSSSESILDVTIKSSTNEVSSEEIVLDTNDELLRPSPSTSRITPEILEAMGKSYTDKAVQTVLPYNFELPQILQDSDEKLLVFTGIDYNILSTFKECAQNVAQHNGSIIENLETKLILTMCKLKLNLTFTSLAVLFGISSATCSRYFYQMVCLLGASVGSIIYWPSKSEILYNMPKCFESYKKTRVVLDCTEIKMQKIKCLKCRILSYSHYKRTHTLKYLIGITPSGLISYLSPGYGGRASDKLIFNSENVIDKLEPYDAIMVDKGILIEKECEQNLITLIRPPFLRKQTQFSKSDADATAKIARARVHVERAIQRIKIFSIVHDEIDWYLLPYMDDIMTIIAAIVNLSNPILADDKF